MKARVDYFQRATSGIETNIIQQYDISNEVSDLHILRPMFIGDVTDLEQQFFALDCFRMDYFHGLRETHV
jgi:hypothetical protein